MLLLVSQCGVLHLLVGDQSHIQKEQSTCAKNGKQNQQINHFFQMAWSCTGRGNGKTKTIILVQSKKGYSQWKTKITINLCKHTEKSNQWLEKTNHCSQMLLVVSDMLTPPGRYLILHSEEQSICKNKRKTKNNNQPFFADGNQYGAKKATLSENQKYQSTCSQKN